MRKAVGGVWQNDSERLLSVANALGRGAVGQQCALALAFVTLPLHSALQSHPGTPAEEHKKISEPDQLTRVPSHGRKCGKHVLCTEWRHEVCGTLINFQPPQPPTTQSLREKHSATRCSQPTHSRPRCYQPTTVRNLHKCRTTFHDPRQCATVNEYSTVLPGLNQTAARPLGGGGSYPGGGGAGLCLKGRGAIREIPERLQSGHRGCEAVGGRLLAVGNAVGAGVGVQGCLWGRVRAGVLGGGGGTPPPLQAIPWGGGMAKLGAEKICHQFSTTTGKFGTNFPDCGIPRMDVDWWLLFPTGLWLVAVMSCWPLAAGLNRHDIT